DDHRPYAKQVGPLGCPVAARAGAVFLTGNDDERRAVLRVLHRRVVDRHGLAAVLRHPTFDAGNHLVANADVGEGAAHHDFVVAAAAAVGVEVLLLDLVLDQVATRRAVSL